MTDATKRVEPAAPYQFGVPLDSALARRERLADRYDYDFGKERVFPQLVEALLAELPEGADVIEIGAATGLLTRPLLTKVGKLTALEPSQGMLRRLVASDVAQDPKLTTRQGLAEDLPPETAFDYAVVTFTPRRGMGLLHLLKELASRVHKSVIMLLDEDGSLDWAFLARAAAVQGFSVRCQIVSEKCEESCRDARRAVILVAEVAEWCRDVQADEAWEFEARTMTVPYPAPRGAATRVVRYFLAGGDRALLVQTDKRGLDRLYGNLRTAVHRLGRDEVTVRRTDEGVQIVRLPRAVE